jgi:hypothetical protein
LAGIRILKEIKKMTWASAVSKRPVSFGHMRFSFGTWTTTGATTGGDIDTGLRKCVSLMLTHKGSGTEAAQAVVNVTYPVDGAAVTIVCTAQDVGYWLAFGY